MLPEGQNTGFKGSSNMGLQKSQSNDKLSRKLISSVAKENASYELRVQIHDLRVQIHEFEFKSTS